jgi:hypothetical protein
MEIAETRFLRAFTEYRMALKHNEDIRGSRGNIIPIYKKEYRMKTESRSYSININRRAENISNV